MHPLDSCWKVPCMMWFLPIGHAPMEQDMELTYIGHQKRALTWEVKYNKYVSSVSSR